MSRLLAFLAVLVILFFTSSLNAGWIGIAIRDDVSEAGAVRGLNVVNVNRDSPAARAGLLAGDVILSVNGKPVGSTVEFVKIIWETPPGEPVEMRIQRKGATLTVKPVASKPPEDIAAYQQGVENLQKGHNEEAISEFTKALKRSPDMADAYFQRARAYEKQEKFDLVIADYTEVIQLEPRSLTAYINRGFAYKNMNLYDQAIQDFSKAAEMKPDVAPTFMARASIYFLKGSYDDAIADCTRAIALLPTMDVAYHNRAAAYEAKGMKQEAKADYERAADAYVQNGLDIAKKGDLDDALSKFDSAIKLNTKYSPAAYYNRGVVYEKKGESLKAVNDYSEAIRLKPDYAEAYLRRGYVFAQKLEDYEKARQDWDRASSLDREGKIGKAARENVDRLGAAEEVRK